MKYLLLFGAMLLHVAGPVNAAPVEKEEQRIALREAARLIEDRYVAVERLDKLMAALDELEREVTTTVEGEDFAATVTARLREVSGDGHLGLSYSEQPIAEPEKTSEQLTLNDDSSSGTARPSTMASRRSSGLRATSCCSTCAHSRHRRWAPRRLRLR
jgi:hypothetical protein